MKNGFFLAQDNFDTRILNADVHIEECLSTSMLGKKIRGKKVLHFKRNSQIIKIMMFESIV